MELHSASMSLKGRMDDWALQKLDITSSTFVQDSVCGSLEDIGKNLISSVP